MPSPSSALSTLRPDLAASFQEYSLQELMRGLIATRVFPVVEVAKASGTFGTIPVEQLLKKHATIRAPGSDYARGKWEFTPATFACIENGWEEPIDDREATMYRDFFDAELVAAQRAMIQILLNAEARVAAAVFNATTWTGSALTTAISNEWDDATNAVPVTDVRKAKQKVFAASGLWPNAVIMNRKVFQNCLATDQVTGLIKYQGFQDVRAGLITPQALAQAFDVDFVLVAGAPYDSALEGQSASISPVWSDEYVMVARVATTPDPAEPCIGRTFHYGEDGSSIGGTIETYRDEKVRGDVVRVRHDVDEVTLYAQAGHLLSNATT